MNQIEMQRAKANISKANQKLTLLQEAVEKFSYLNSIGADVKLKNETLKIAALELRDAGKDLAAFFDSFKA